MSDQDPKEVVRRLFQAFNDRQFDRLEGTVFSPALVYRHNGREADLKRWIRDSGDCIASFPDAQMIPEEQIESGDRVTTRFRFRGTQPGPGGRDVPGGKKFDVAGSAISRIMDGLIVEETEQVDEKALGRQLGLD